MESPLVILLELFVGLIMNAIETVGFIGLKMSELFVSLGFIAGTSILGFIVAVAIAAAVIAVILKFILGSSKSTILIVVGAAVVFMILLIALA